RVLAAGCAARDFDQLDPVLVELLRVRAEAIPVRIGDLHDHLALLEQAIEHTADLERFIDREAEREIFEIDEDGELMLRAGRVTGSGHGSSCGEARRIEEEPDSRQRSHGTDEWVVPRLALPRAADDRL